MSIQYKLAYMKISGSGSSELILEIYNQTVPTTYGNEDLICNDKTNWVSLNEFEKQGWKLIQILNKNQMMVGIFILETTDQLSLKYDVLIKELTDNIERLKEQSELLKKYQQHSIESNQQSMCEIVSFKDSIDKLIKSCVINVETVKDRDNDVVNQLSEILEVLLDVSKSFKTQQVHNETYVSAPTPIKETQEKQITKEVELVKTLLKPIEPPPPPRIIYESDSGPFCLLCGSSLKKKFFKRTNFCIQPKCTNYWNKNNA